MCASSLGRWPWVQHTKRCVHLFVVPCGLVCLMFWDISHSARPAVQQAEAEEEIWRAAKGNCKENEQVVWLCHSMCWNEACPSVERLKFWKLVAFGFFAFWSRIMANGHETLSKCPLHIELTLDVITFLLATVFLITMLVCHGQLCKKVDIFWLSDTDEATVTVVAALTTRELAYGLFLLLSTGSL